MLFGVAEFVFVICLYLFFFSSICCFLLLLFVSFVIVVFLLVLYIFFSVCEHGHANLYFNILFFLFYFLSIFPIFVNSFYFWIQLVGKLRQGLTIAHSTSIAGKDEGGMYLFVFC